MTEQELTPEQKREKNAAKNTKTVPVGIRIPIDIMARFEAIRTKWAPPDAPDLAPNLAKIVLAAVVAGLPDLERRAGIRPAKKSTPNREGKVKRLTFPETGGAA